MTGYPVIGGKADGQRCVCKVVSTTIEGDEYLLVSFRDKGKPGTHYFYMLVGMVPADAQKIYRERIKQE